MAIRRWRRRCGTSRRRCRGSSSRRSPRRSGRSSASAWPTPDGGCSRFPSTRSTASASGRQLRPRRGGSARPRRTKRALSPSENGGARRARRRAGAPGSTRSRRAAVGAHLSPPRASDVAASPRRRAVPRTRARRRSGRRAGDHEQVPDEVSVAQSSSATTGERPPATVRRQIRTGAARSTQVDEITTASPSPGSSATARAVVVAVRRPAYAPRRGSGPVEPIDTQAVRIASVIAEEGRAQVLDRRGRADEPAGAGGKVAVDKSSPAPRMRGGDVLHPAQVGEIVDVAIDVDDVVADGEAVAETRGIRAIIAHRARRRRGSRAGAIPYNRRSCASCASPRSSSSRSSTGSTSS